MANKNYLNFTQLTPNKVRINIDGTIGGFDWNTLERTNTGKDIRKQLDEISAMNADEIEVLITSLGGYVDDALQIHDALKAHPAKVTTIVQGFCASSATVIACAGDTRIISPNALYLIHKCSSYVEGNENALQVELEDQRKINDTIINIYKGVLKKDVSDLRLLFEANDGKGKWITAEEALAFGFATEIQDFEDGKNKPVTAMARFLNHARNVLPGMNIINNQNQKTMKKFLLTFAMLGELLAIKDDAEYDEKTGMLLNPEQLQKLEDKLKDVSDLEAQASKNESELQKAQKDLASATADIAEKDKLIASLTAERDDYKAKYENAPANVPGVNGKDVKPEPIDVTDNPVYDELGKYL